MFYFEKKECSDKISCQKYSIVIVNYCVWYNLRRVSPTGDFGSVTSGSGLNWFALNRPPHNIHTNQETLKNNLNIYPTLFNFCQVVLSDNYFTVVCQTSVGFPRYAQCHGYF